MQKNAQVNGDTKWNNTSQIQKNSAPKEKGENLNKMDQNKEFVKCVRTSNHYHKGPTASLSDTGLLDNSLTTTTQNQEKIKKLHLFMNAMNNDEVELNLTESGQSIFLSVKPFKIENNKKNLRNNYYELMQHEVNHLKEKFELNNRNYQMDDLIRLTDNSKKILNYGVMDKYSNYDDKRKFIYYNQECRKVEIERKIGLSLFLKVYERMINIIDDEFGSNLRNSLEHKSENLKPFNFGGDSGDIIKNEWKQIIGILDEKQEYLPDIWEFAMSEYMFYHM